MCDIVLVNLPVSLWYKKELAEQNSMPPLGVLYIATVLNHNGVKTKVLDLSVELMDKKELDEYFTHNAPKIVGISTYNESWEAQKVFCQYIKGILPDVKIIAGGAFATFYYDECLNESLTDFVLQGEGEISFLKLSRYLLYSEGHLEDVDGLVRKKDGEIVVNERKERINDLDSLPFPNRNLVNLSKYTIPFTINTARGCPGDCIFCSSRAFWGHRVYMRSAQNIYKEILHIYKEYKSNQFCIADDTFTVSKKRALEVCHLIKNSHINFIWGCESRADVIDELLIKELYEAGCRKIQFGMESADNDILKKLKKHVTVEQIENAISLAYKYGMHITVSYIIGHAFDTVETIERTLDFAKYIKEKYGVYLAVSVNTPFKGTEQYEKRTQYGIEIHTDDLNRYHLSNPIVSTKQLSINQIRYYFQKAIKIMKG